MATCSDKHCLTGYAPELGEYEPASRQLALLRELQADKPHLNFHIPSVFESIVSWYSLRHILASQEDRLFRDTHTLMIRHLDLQPVPHYIDRDKKIPGYYIPGTFISRMQTFTTATFQPNNADLRLPTSIGLG